nr:hypothetical protein [Tanacetum cinerariifolium]
MPKDDFILVVRRVWNSKIDGFSMFSLVSKLKLLKKPLRKLNFKQGNLFENVVCLKAELAIMQSSMSDDPHNKALREEELRLLKAYKTALKDEELFLRQKAKVEWLKASDRNLKYFHNVVKGRCNRNRISYIENMDGVPFHGNNVGDQLKLPVFEALNLVRIVSNEEINLALFDIDGNKAPGPNGFSYQFFKDSWGVVGDEVCKAVKDFFSNGKILKQINATVISLMPKVAAPSKHFDFLELMVKWIMNCVSSTSFTVNVNGDHTGFFKGMWGLRQGDPLSPYLFTLVIEVFNLVLRREIDKNLTFRLHCSVAVLKNAISIFGGLSGLLPNLTKCTVFFGNVREARKRLLDWKNKSFSFAGRLQLIKSVLCSLQVYWASVFILPSAIANDIERLVMNFLWNYRVFKRGKACVNWNSMCKPKVEGGLGIKSLGFWNKSLMSKHIWNIITQKESLWVRSHIFHKIGDGKNTSLWFDNWHALCPLSDFISKRNIFASGLSLGCNVADVIRNGAWVWPYSISNSFDALSVIPPSVLVHDKSEVVRWKSLNAFLDRLKTHDNLHHWDKYENLLCVLCGKVSESRDHLFFECNFHNAVWCRLKDMVKLDHALCSWIDILKYLLNRLRVLSLSMKPSPQVFDAADIWNFHVCNEIGSKRVNFATRNNFA